MRSDLDTPPANRPHPAPSLGSFLREFFSSLVFSESKPDLLAGNTVWDAGLSQYNVKLHKLDLCQMRTIEFGWIDVLPTCMSMLVLRRPRSGAPNP